MAYIGTSLWEQPERLHRFLTPNLPPLSRALVQNGYRDAMRCDALLICVQVRTCVCRSGLTPTAQDPLPTHGGTGMVH
eukprot:6345593-Heterocapsa_arctica.AAC.1